MPDRHSAPRQLPRALLLTSLISGLAGNCSTGPAAAAGMPPMSPLDQVQVSATRFAESVQEVPATLSVISADDLAARGIHDLRGALSQLAGVTVSQGGDGGSSEFALGLLGRREADDFLLVIDGVPAGGAFTPQFAGLDLTGIERIEVIRGTAPVYYGTTAFAGTIALFHHAAGHAPARLSVSAGSFGTLAVSALGSLAAGPLQQSLAVDLHREAGSDPRAAWHRAHALYRLAGGLGGGSARFDLDALSLHDRPASPTPYAGTHALLPVDFNQTPGDAHIDTQRIRAVFGFDRPLEQAQWSSLLSFAHSHTGTVTGFLDSDWQSASATNASGYGQQRGLDDVFLDSHLTGSWLEGVDTTAGVNLLDGQLAMQSQPFAYRIDFGQLPPGASGSWPVLDNVTLGDHRTYGGLYAQTRWRASPAFSVLAGLRWNHIREHRDGWSAQEGADHESFADTRWSGSLGFNWWAWKDASGDLDDLSLYASLANTFQPAQADFGPDPQTGAILQPEGLRSLEFGIKADGLDGALDASLSLHGVRFSNRPVAVNQAGEPAVVAGGEERFRGLEFEFGWRPRADLRLDVEYGWNHATYGNFTTLIDGTPTPLAGQRIEFVPERLAGFDLSFLPSAGWHAALGAHWIGRRFLDPQGQAAAGAALLFDAMLGYRWTRLELRLSATNLGDQRIPMQASELGPGQVYRMPGRRLLVTLEFAPD